MTASGLGTRDVAAAWTSWMKACEVAVSAPVVIGLRLTGMAVAGPNPSAADRREARRMGQEKVDAWWDGLLASANIVAAANVRLAGMAAEAMMAGTLLPVSALSRVGLGVAPRVGAAVVNPVHRRVRANRRRLAARR